MTQPAQPGPVPVKPAPRIPKQQLLQIVQVASCVQCVWWTDKRPQLGERPSNEKAWIVVGIQSIGNIAVDEKRLAYNSVTDQNDSIVIGHRSFTLTLQARSIDAELEAYDLLERVRFRLRTDEVRALMVPTIALVTIQPIVVVGNISVNNRIVPSANMDVRMKCAVSADPQDTGGANGDYIASDSDNFATIGTLIP